MPGAEIFPTNAKSPFTFPDVNVSLKPSLASSQSTSIYEPSCTPVSDINEQRADALLQQKQTPRFLPSRGFPRVTHASLRCASRHRSQRPDPCHLYRYDTNERRDLCPEAADEPSPSFFSTYILTPLVTQAKPKVKNHTHRYAPSVFLSPPSSPLFSPSRLPPPFPSPSLSC